MIREAIQYLLNMNEMTNANKHLIDHTEGVLLSDKDVKLVDFEPMLPNRRRFRGSFVTSSPKAFLEYIQKYNFAGSCFVDSRKMSAKHIFDFGTEEKPGHCSHTASLIMEIEPNFKDFIDMSGKKMGQKDFFDELLSLKQWLLFVDENGDRMPGDRALLAIKNIEVKAAGNREHQVSNHGYQQSTMEKLTAESKHTLPAEVWIEGTAFQSLTPKTIKANLVVYPGESLQLALRITNMTEFKLDAAEDLRDLFSEHDLTHYEGKFNE